MKVYASTDIGKMRANNEDAFYLPLEGESFCAVADGMGGHNAGEVASEIAIREFSRIMREADSLRDAIKAAVERANVAIYEAARGREALKGMGTTLIGFCVDGGEVFLAHVGDSRAYLIRNGAIVRVTTDHTLVEEMVARGVISIEKARVHPKRNYVTRILGTSAEVEVDVIRMDLQKGDIYLLCSDGLSSYVSEREMRDIAISTGLSGDEKVASLIERALQYGGSDNITAVLVTCEEDLE